MKHLIWFLVCLLLLSLQPAFGAGNEQKRKIIPPKECRTSRYSCILKKVDGVPFFCLRTTKQRYQNARKTIRKVKQRSCLRRYPVEYEEIEKKPDNSE